MKKILWILCFVMLAKLAGAASPKTIMLVLGSANPIELNERIAVAARLYQVQPIQKVIVSGGCAAHGSGICEATRMLEGLVEKGVERSRIYKEENSKTTVQNYVFSRVLRDENDQRIIQPGDTVFVVSNHWHAMSVAARLQQYDGVTARYYIEGNIQPKPNDKLDYGAIFNGETDNDKFVLRGSWLTPEAVWQEGNKRYYLSDAVLYIADADNQQSDLRSSEEALPFLASLDSTHSRAFIDAGDYWWVRNGGQLLKVDKASKAVLARQDWNSWISGMPDSWKKGAFQTGVQWGKTLLLFANEKILVARLGKNGPVFEKECKAGDYFTNWPFSWGNSNVSSANLDAQAGMLVLFRNRETLQVDRDLQVIGKAEPIGIKWIAE